jgi:ubiquinone/menaquinone biosynthesis C-methylase UbiE
MTERGPIRSAWTDSLALGRQPDAAALRAHLRAVHSANAGFTEQCASACRDAAGRNSYEWLAETVDARRHASVLDLACGSGPLLQILHARHPDMALTGVDMSGDELALARRRLPPGAARLIESEAQAMTALPDGSVDVVLCHWALTLMDPVAPVLNEVRRVLAPCGRFAALVDGPMDAAPGYRAAHDLIYSHVQAEVPGYGQTDLGDARVRGAAPLVDLVRAAFPSADVHVDTGVVAMAGPRAAVAEAAAGFFYAAFVLPSTRRARMLAELGAALPPGDDAGACCFSMPVNRLVAAL